MKNQMARIDLHGMLSLDAECALKTLLNSLPDTTHTVQVIHGIGIGALKQMTADLYHHRIVHRVHCIGNPGQTNLYIKPNH